MPLTKDRNTLLKEGTLFDTPIAAATKIYAGSLVALDASGDAVPGSVAATLTGYGRAEAQIDNGAGLAGDKSVLVRKGVFQFANSAAADEITRAEIGDDCYIVDDQTVAKTDGGATRSVAGKIADIAPGGVWVKFD